MKGESVVMCLLYKEDINDLRKKIEERYPQNIQILNLTIYMKNLAVTEHLQGTIETNFISI